MYWSQLIPSLTLLQNSQNSLAHIFHKNSISKCKAGYFEPDQIVVKFELMYRLDHQCCLCSRPQKPRNWLATSSIPDVLYCLLSPSGLVGRGRRTPCSMGIRVFSKQCPKSLVLSNLDEDSTTSDLSPLGMKNHALVILCT